MMAGATLVAASIVGKADLLFPSDVGGFVSPSSLDKPFEDIAAVAKIKKPITPRAMRRTAQDLSRLAGVNDLDRFQFDWRE